jgi:NAD(P)-dependent dehydrogenase (short-subunit alcohol dehydrogenase family)
VSPPLFGRVALVTGATSGIGRACAVRLARDGAVIIGTGRNDGEAAITADQVAAAGGTFHFRRQDVTDEGQWDDLTTWIDGQFGRLDVAVNSAGVFFSKPLPDTSLEEWRWLWQVDVEASFLATRAELALMRKTGSKGSVINMASLAGLIGLEDCSAYCPAKAALVQMSKIFALEAAAFPVKCRVNVVCPGVIWTEMITKQYGDSDAVKGFSIAGNALPLLGLPEDVAGAVAYLASDASRYVTATQLVIDGGRGAD